VEGDEVVLCTDCRKGARIQLVVVTQGAWDRFPGVSVVDVTQPAVDGAEQAVEWLRMIDEKGSRKYRERASETGQ